MLKTRLDLQSELLSSQAPLPLAPPWLSIAPLQEAPHLRLAVEPQSPLLLGPQLNCLVSPAQSGALPFMGRSQSPVCLGPLAFSCSFVRYRSISSKYPVLYC